MFKSEMLFRMKWTPTWAFNTRPLMSTKLSRQVAPSMMLTPVQLPVMSQWCTLILREYKEKSYMLIMQSMKLSSTKLEIFNIYLVYKVQIISVYKKMGPID